MYRLRGRFVSGRVFRSRQPLPQDNPHDALAFVHENLTVPDGEEVEMIRLVRIDPKASKDDKGLFSISEKAPAARKGGKKEGGKKSR